MNQGYPDSFVMCGGFPSDSAILMEKRFILMLKKFFISLQLNTAIFSVIPDLYYCSVVFIC